MAAEAFRLGTITSGFISVLRLASARSPVSNVESAGTVTKLTGAPMFEQVVANTATLMLSYVTGGGLPALPADARGWRANW